MLIDFHTHMFPDALAAKTLPRLSHIAAKPGRQKTVNRFAAEVQARNKNMLASARCT